jgi:hypothetical protein
VALKIAKGGAIKIWDSRVRLGPSIRHYAQLVLPLYANLIALDPSNIWIPDAFTDCRVDLESSPQQYWKKTGYDSGPAATTMLIHLIRMEPAEITMNGSCFRFVRLTMIYNEMFGACPFSFGANDTA